VTPDVQAEADLLSRQLHAEILLANTRIAHIRASANANAFDNLLNRIRESADAE